jgi:hypothetical protein
MVIAQNIALLTNFTMHSAAHGPVACTLPDSLARQPCPAALPGSLARQPCPAVRPISTGFDARARSAVTALYYSGRSPNCIRALFLVQFHNAFIMCHQCDGIHHAASTKLL